MKIGIDIDEIVVEFLEGYISHYNKKFSKNVKWVDFNSYNFWEVLPIDKSLAIELASEFFSSPAFDNLSFIDGSKDSINLLIKSHQIFFITSRPSEWKEKTHNFLNSHFIPNNFDILFSSDFHNSGKGKKSEICEQLQIPLLIEDNKHYALECAEKGITVLLFDKPWNQGVSHTKIKRVFSWEEINREIKKIGVKT